MSSALTVRDVLFAAPRQRQQASDLLRDLGGRPSELAFEARSERTLLIPAELGHIMTRVLEVLASGGTVTIGSLPPELTTTVAAEQLGVSRPTLMKMIRNGEIPARKVGSHHRLKTADVLAVKHSKHRRQVAAFAELRELEDELAQDEEDPR